MGPSFNSLFPESLQALLLQHEKKTKESTGEMCVQFEGVWCLDTLKVLEVHFLSFGCFLAEELRSS